MTKILKFTQFIFESDGKIYSVSGDPYQYKVVNGTWMTKGQNIKNWTSLEGNKKANDILDARHPEARSGQKIADETPEVKGGIVKQDPTMDYVSNSSPKALICAHAGKWDGAGSSKAENCLRNIELNIKGGTDMIEIDIQITSDGVPVLFHDGTLDAKTNGSGKIQNMKWDQVKNITYNSDPSQRICSLQEVVSLIEKYKSRSILQLDKCDASELSIINRTGILKGLEGQVVAKGTSFAPPSIVGSMGIKWMPILPSSNVGKMTSKEAVDVVASRVKPGFFEYQFSDVDSYIVNGYMSDALRAKGVSPMVVAVGGTKDTNGVSYRGDSKNSWKKIIDNVKPSLIMTNRPSQLRSYLG